MLELKFRGTSQKFPQSRDKDHHSEMFFGSPSRSGASGKTDRFARQLEKSPLNGQSPFYRAVPQRDDDKQEEPVGRRKPERKTG
jgi:hypothetical protein